jgi:hypothetical protein
MIDDDKHDHTMRRVQNLAGATERDAEEAQSIMPSAPNLAGSTQTLGTGALNIAGPTECQEQGTLNPAGPMATTIEAGTLNLAGPTKVSVIKPAYLGPVVPKDLRMRIAKIHFEGKKLRLEKTLAHAPTAPPALTRTLGTGARNVAAPTECHELGAPNPAAPKATTIETGALNLMGLTESIDAGTLNIAGLTESTLTETGALDIAGPTECHEQDAPNPAGPKATIIEAGAPYLAGLTESIEEGTLNLAGLTESTLTEAGTLNLAGPTKSTRTETGALDIADPKCPTDDITECHTSTLELGALPGTPTLAPSADDIAVHPPEAESRDVPPPLATHPPLQRTINENLRKQVDDLHAEIGLLIAAQRDVRSDDIVVRTPQVGSASTRARKGLLDTVENVVTRENSRAAHNGEVEAGIVAIFDKVGTNKEMHEALTAAADEPPCDNRHAYSLARGKLKALGFPKDGYYLDGGHVRNYRNNDHALSYLDLINLFKDLASADEGKLPPEPVHAPQDDFGYPDELFDPPGDFSDDDFPNVPDIDSILASEDTAARSLNAAHHPGDCSFPAIESEINAHLKLHSELESKPKCGITPTGQESFLANTLLHGVEVLHFVECRFSLGPMEEVHHLKAVLKDISRLRYGLELGRMRQRRVRDLGGDIQRKIVAYRTAMTDEYKLLFRKMRDCTLENTIVSEEDPPP